MGLFLSTLVVLIGLFFGLRADKKHFQYLKSQEEAFADITLLNLKRIDGLETAQGRLVTGNVVVANDAFKKFLSALLMFFGGRIGVYETLMERARREALVRMQKEARNLGASKIINIRIETSTIKGNTPKSIGSIEMLAYGTAIY